MINEINAKKFCKDDISKIENYDKAVTDTTQTWHCHHRLELTLDGEFAHSAEELRRLEMYYDRPYFELIFLTSIEHHRLHNANISDETRRKMSESQKGKTMNDETKRKLSDTNKGKTISDEVKKKLSVSALRRYSDPAQRQKISDAKKGKTLSDEHRQHLSEAWVRRKMHSTKVHFSAETRRKISEALKGKPSHNKGKPMSDEQKRKISEAAKRTWAKRKAAEAAEL